MTWRAAVAPCLLAGVRPQQRPDVYWLWAELTGYAGVCSVDKPGPVHEADWVSVLCEAESFDALERLALPDWMKIPPHYRHKVTPTEGLRFFTARVLRRNLAELSQLSGIKRWELGLASTPPLDGTWRTKPPDVKVFGFMETTDGRPGTIGIIDNGLAFRNAQFIDRDRLPAQPVSRVSRLWDQGLTPGPTDGQRWAAGDMGYGRQALAQWLWPGATGWDGPPDYRDGRYLQSPADGIDDLRSAPQARPATSGRDVLRWTHGTHVAHVAAGRSDPARLQADDALAGDPASKASICFVNLPLLTALDSSGGSLAVHVLDALRYIVKESEPDKPLLVNLSYGTQAGPHDGSSMIEEAMDELSERLGDRFAIVLGAGNSRKARAHASRKLGTKPVEPLLWEVSAGDLTDSFVEIWYQAAPGSANVDADGLTVRVVDPHGRESPWVGKAQATALEIDGAPVAALFHLPQPAGGQTPMILLALRPSAAGSGGARSPSGVWRIELKREKHVKPIRLHAWIERDDAPPGAVALTSQFLGTVVEDGTLSNLATGSKTLVVGARRLQAQNHLVDYSSLGRIRGGARATASPNLLAPADQDEALRGLRATAVRTGDNVRMSGTSVAAPVFARRLFNAMVASPGTPLTTLVDQVVPPPPPPRPPQPMPPAKAPALRKPPAAVDPDRAAPEPPSLVL